jgi:hypothetical protein
MGLHALRHALFLLATALLAGHAGAQEGATIAVDCPTLDAESRAAVEARARADLLVRNTPGTFVVVCSAGEGRLSWHPLAGVPQTATVPLDADPRANVDRILEGLENLVAAGATPIPTVETSGSAQPPPLASPPDASAAAPVPGPRTPLEPPPATPATFGEPWRSGFRGVLLGGGIGGELWSNTAALGPRASVLLSLPAGFEAGAAATVFFTLRSPYQVNGRAIRVALTGAYPLDRGERFHVGADVFLDLVHAAAPNAGTANDAAFGVLLRATAALIIAPLRIELGPTVALHPTRMQAQIGPAPNGADGNVAFTLQRFTAGLVLDVLAGPL